MTIYKLNAYRQILEILYVCIIYSKICFKWSLQKKTKIGFKERLSLNAGQTIAECSKESILQYFQPSSSYHLSLRSLFCLLLSGRLRLVLLYVKVTVNKILFKPQESGTLHTMWRYSDLVVE